MDKADRPPDRPGEGLGGTRTDWAVIPRWWSTCREAVLAGLTVAQMRVSPARAHSVSSWLVASSIAEWFGQGSRRMEARRVDVIHGEGRLNAGPGGAA